MMIFYFTILHMMLLLCLLQMFNQSLAIPGHSHRNRKEGTNPSRKAMLLRENDRLVANINAKTNSKWTAESYEEMALLSRQQKKHMLLGVPLDEGIEVVPIEDEHLQIVRKVSTSSEQQQPITCELDDEFDLRKRWPECAEIVGTIQDQAGCGSCWAVATASAFTDRLCIERSKQAKGQWWPLSGDLPVPAARTAYNWRSALDLLSCSTNSYGCRGGWPKHAWKWIVENGIASGGNYSMDAGCKPYPFKSPPRWEMTPPCENKCTNNSWTQSASVEQLKLMDFDRKYRGKASGYVHLDWRTSSTNEQTMKEELLANGSIVVAFHVYEDFFAYKTGVYKRTSNVHMSGHAVRLIGWGTQRCSDGSEQKYWLAANSWNTWWGDNGFFRILRGVDECGIESKEVSFGFPIVRTNVDSIRYHLKPNNTWCNEFMKREFGNGNGTDSSSNSNSNSLGDTDDESKESRQIFRHAKPMNIKEFESENTKPFMAISFLLTGGEEGHRSHHKAIKEKIVNFLQNNSVLTSQLLILYSDQPSLNAHFKRQHKGNTYELEIAAASILFQVHFLVFVNNSRRNIATNDGKWLYFSPDFPYSEQDLDDQRPSVALYYDTFKRHFGAILDLEETENVIF